MLTALQLGALVSMRAGQTWGWTRVCTVLPVTSEPCLNELYFAGLLHVVPSSLLHAYERVRTIKKHPVSGYIWPMSIGASHVAARGKRNVALIPPLRQSNIALGLHAESCLRHATEQHAGSPTPWWGWRLRRAPATSCLPCAASAPSTRPARDEPKRVSNRM